MLKFRKKSQHSQCGQCFQLGQDIRLARSMQRRLEAARTLRRHLQDQFADRRIYWSLRHASRRRDDVLTIIIDSMDKTKFAVPRWQWARKPKNLESLNRPRLVCTGAMAHGWGTHIFLSDEDLGHGSNAFCEVLIQTLEKVARTARTAGQCGQYGQAFPRHLVVLCDNTTSQAKNSVAANLMAVLVGRYKFLTANLLFLRVGHTHEDIGQDPKKGQAGFEVGLLATVLHRELRQKHSQSPQLRPAFRLGGGHCPPAATGAANTGRLRQACCRLDVPSPF